jgi:hypothetical protein
MSTLTNKHHLWLNYLNRLKTKCVQDGIPFTLTPAYVLTLPQDKCTLTKVEMVRGNNSTTAPTLMLLDKSLGYVEGNVMVVASSIATTRQTLSAVQLILLCRRFITMIEDGKLNG